MVIIKQERSKMIYVAFVNNINRILSVWITIMLYKVKATQDDTGAAELESLSRDISQKEDELKGIAEKITNFQNQRLLIR